MLHQDVLFISILFRIVYSVYYFQLSLFMISKYLMYIIKTVSRLVLSIQAYFMVNSGCFVHINII